MNLLLNCVSFFFFIQFFISIPAPWFAVAATPYEEVEFTYDKGPLGPLHWGDLKPEWKTCKVGKKQSPVAITGEHLRHRHFHRLHLHYIDGEAALERSAYDVAVLWKDNGGIFKVNGTEYCLKELHIHHPSEHKIHGVRYPLEVHVVHESLDKKLAVISIHYGYGEEEDGFLAKITGKLHWMCRNNQTSLDIGHVKLDHTKFKGHYFQYKGSLTTPPCTEGVIWTVMKKNLIATEEQIKAVVEAAGFKNNRPLQKLHGRSIFYFH